MKECIVCFNTDWITHTKCEHIICIECLFKLQKDECPMCRREIKKTLPKNLRNLLNCAPVPKKEGFDLANINDFPPLG